MLDQEVGIERRRNAAPARVQVLVQQKMIIDLRRKGFLHDSDIFSKEAIGRAVMKACVAGIKATE